MNYSGLSFLSDLEKHIKRVISEDNQALHLDKIKVTGGQISKKATVINQKEVRSRELGEGASAEVDISEKQSIELIGTYLEHSDWDSVLKLCENVLFENPVSYSAVLYTLFAKYKIHGLSDFEYNITSFRDTQLIDKYLSCADKESSGALLDAIYGMKKINDNDYANLLHVILPYNYSNRSRNFNTVSGMIIKNDMQKSFEELISALPSDNVDKYIELNNKYAKALFERNKFTRVSTYTDRVLSVDEGNKQALEIVFKNDVIFGQPTVKTITDFEALLKYSEDVNGSVISAMDYACRNTTNQRLFELISQLAKYYDGDKKPYIDILIRAAEKLREKEMTYGAEYFLKIVTALDKNNPAVYWNLCLLNIGAKDADDIINRDKPINDCPEFNKYLLLIDKNERDRCLQLALRQKEAITDRQKSYNSAQKRAAEAKARQQEQALAKYNEEKAKARKANISTVLILLFPLLLGFIPYVLAYIEMTYMLDDWMALIFLLIIPALCIFIHFMSRNDSNERNSLFIKILISWTIIVIIASFFTDGIALCFFTPVSFSIFNISAIMHIKDKHKFNSFIVIAFIISFILNFISILINFNVL